MSTEYRVVDKNRKQALGKLQTFLNKERDALLDRTRSFFHEHPELEDFCEDQLYRMKKTDALRVMDYQLKRHTIGVSKRTGFSWRLRNGFRDADSVREFLNQHPGWVIESEYGDEIPLEQFLQNIS